MGPIPHSAVAAYADRLGMDGDEADWLAGLIGEMDRTYGKWVEDQKPRK